MPLREAVKRERRKKYKGQQSDKESSHGSVNDSVIKKLGRVFMTLSAQGRRESSQLGIREDIDPNSNGLDQFFSSSTPNILANR